MKKSLIAMAVAGVASAPMAAHAAPEVYGIFDVGLESYSSDNGGTGTIFPGFNQANGNSDGNGAALVNGLTSRLGVRGSEDLGGGLTASYRFEFAYSGALTDGAQALTTRLGWAAFNGDFGQVKIGTQWQDAFAYSAWNVHRTDLHGYGTWYWTTGLYGSGAATSLSYGLRQDSTIKYQYGGGGYSTDPFTFGIQAQVGQGTAANEEALSSLSAYAAGSFGPVTINGGINQRFEDRPGVSNEAEPSMLNLGGRFRLNDMVELGANWTSAEADNANDVTRDAFNFAGHFSFGNGWSAHAGVGLGEADGDGPAEGGADLTDIYGYVKKALSSRTDVRLEFETVEEDQSDNATTNVEGEDTVVMLGLQHNF